MGATQRLAIIQPNNKNLLASNGEGRPLDLSAAKDVVRSNDSQPSNGVHSFIFTSPTDVVVNGVTTSVITDGVTYNNNIGGSGIDIVFKSNRRKRDFCVVEVLSASTENDTYLFEGRSTRNFGSCTFIEFGNSRVGAGAKRCLIKFEPPKILNVAVLDSTVFLYGSDRFSTQLKNYRFYEILPANDGWIEGEKCDTNAGSEPTWRRRDDFLLIPWVGAAAGGTNGCSVSGTDYIPTHLFDADVTSTSDAWVEFSQNSTLLNDFIGKILVDSTQNIGFVGETFEPQQTSDRFICFSAEYTTDKALRPKMLFLYEEEIGGKDSVVDQNYPSTLGTEDTFGGN